MPEMIKQTDVAKAAGVARSAVSMYLNNYPGVSEKAKQKIASAIKKLNYRPDDMARSIKTGKSKAIGYIHSSIAYETLRGMLAASTQRGYIIEPIYFDEHDQENVKKTLRYIQNRRIAAVSINIGHPAVLRLIEELKKMNIPSIFSASLSHNAPKGILEIESDTRKSMRLIADHLLAMGHRDLLYIQSICEVGKYRYEILDEYIRSKYQHVRLRRVEMDIFSSDEFAKNIFIPCRDSMPTALVCSNPGAASLASYRFLEHGLRTPDDVSIISYGDSLNNSFLNISSLREKSHEMGEYVCEKLINMIKHNIDNEDAQEFFDVDLIIRGSVKKRK